MGLGYALTEEVRFKDGAVLDRNFDSYEMPRFSWLPKIETVLIDNPETPPPAAANRPSSPWPPRWPTRSSTRRALRMPQLPMTPARILAELKTG